MNERLIHRLFEAGIFLKGAHALVECVGGVLLRLVSNESITSWVAAMTRSELVEDPRDLVANSLLQLAQGFSVETKTFYAWYLLSHGVIKLALVFGLWREKLWAYPAALLALSLFIVYQFYRYSYTHSPVLILLSVFDVFFMALVAHEYRLMLKQRESADGS